MIENVLIDYTIFCPECNAILVNRECPNGCTLINFLEDEG